MTDDCPRKTILILNETHRKLYETWRNTAEARLDEIENLQAKFDIAIKAITIMAIPNGWCGSSAYEPYKDLAEETLDKIKALEA